MEIQFDQVLGPFALSRCPSKLHRKGSNARFVFECHGSGGESGANNHRDCSPQMISWWVEWLDEPQVQAVLLGIWVNVGYIVGWRRQLRQRIVLVGLRSWSLPIDGLRREDALLGRQHVDSSCDDGLVSAEAGCFW